MSTIILYKNNKTLKLPILKFITSNKRFENDNSIKKEIKKNENDNSKEMTNINKNKKTLNLSTLEDISLNSEILNISKNNEKGVQTIQTSFRDKIKINNKIRLFNILKHANVATKKKQKNNEFDNGVINSEKIYRINQKNRKKLLENYSQINSYFNNLYFKKNDNVQNKIFKFSNATKLPNLRKKINNHILNKKKSDLNKTEDDSEKKVIKKNNMNIAKLFHNDMIKNNIKKEKKLELNKENFKNNFCLRKNHLHKNNSLPNIIFNSKDNKIFWKEDKSNLIKSNGRFLLKIIKRKNKKIE